MRTLYHHPLSPACRLVRLALGEKEQPFTLVLEKPWDRRADFLALNPSGEVPVLVEEDGFVITEPAAALEYLQELKVQPNLVGLEPHARITARSLMHFFARVFYRDCTLPILGQKALLRLQGFGTPDGALLRSGYAALTEHMKHVNYLAEQNNWLAGDALSFADLSAAAQISVLDYLGDIAWERFPEAKSWYARIKSRPSFRPLLADSVTGLAPPPHYANLDF